MKIRCAGAALPLLLTLLLLFVFPGGMLLAETELELHGHADTTFAAGFMDTSEMLGAKVSFHPEVEFFAGNLYCTASMNASWDALVPSRFNFSLGEVYAEYAGNGFDFRLGRQIVSWGRADGVQITDIICPRDFTELAGVEYKDSRVPVTGLKLRQYGNIYSLEALWIPVYTPSLLPVDDSSPLKEVFFPPQAVPLFVEDAAVPAGIEDGELAFRGSLFLSALDLSVSVFRGWNHVPVFDKTLSAGPPPSLSLKPVFHRIWMTGLDAAIPVDAFVFRLEAAWTGEQPFMSKEAPAPGTTVSPVLKDQVKALAGADWNPGAGWMLTVQYMEDVVLEHSEKLLRPRRLPLGTFSVSKTLLRETLELSGAVVLGFDALDTYSSFKARYALVDDFHLTLGLALYQPGREDGTFGSMEELSHLWLRGRFSF